MVDSSKIYYDTSGNKLSLSEMVKAEPEWAAGVIRFYETKVAELEEQLEKLNSTPEPTEEQWNGLARDIVFWWGMNDHTGDALYKHLRRSSVIAPEWLLEEIPNSNAVPSKGTVAAVIYKAMVYDFKNASGNENGK